MTRATLVLWLVACGSEPKTTTTPGGGTPVGAVSGPVDLDGDGHTDDVDCDDLDAAVNPDAIELCNGKDDDCDGDVDGGATDASTFYEDLDGDGFGNAGVEVEACERPAGHSPIADDCDDGDAGAWPGAPEVCNGIDDDCDLATDEDASDAVTVYLDGDGDGFGEPGTGATACPAGGQVHTDGDCDDGDSAVHPGAAEICNGLDDDCDARIDDDDPAVDPSGFTDWHPDLDGDGFGDDGLAVASCDPPPGWTSQGGDCHDGLPATYPGAVEWCDERDNDCDGLIDEGAIGGTSWYADADGDGFGAPGAAAQACTAPPGMVADDSDCDDGAPDVHPGAHELCNTVDDDCNGIADDGAIDGTAWFLDVDGDGFGDPTTLVLSCGSPAGRTTDNQDCDDSSAFVHPGAPEVCDAVDQDCNGAIDDEPVDGLPWYADLDGDGYGRSTAPTWACSPPAGTVGDSTDCDDSQASVHPNAQEQCDGVDQDCDGLVDEGAVGTPGYADSDGDGHGNPLAPVSGCPGAPGFATSSDDCDDADPGVHPGRLEYCDGVDEDCNGTEAGAVTFFPASGDPQSLTVQAATWSGITIADEGTLVFCDGTFDNHVRVTAPVDVVITSLNGPLATTLDPNGAGGVIHAGDDGTPVPQAHTLTVRDLRMRDMDGDAGAIASLSGHLVVEGSDIDNVTAIWSGAVGAVHGDTALRNTTLDGADSPWAAVGGAYGRDIRVEAGSAIRTTVGTVIREPSVVAEAGAIVVQDSTLDTSTDVGIELSSSALLLDNVALVDLTGGVLVETGAVTLTNVTASNTSIQTGSGPLNVSGGVFELTPTWALATETGSITIDGATIQDNVHSSEFEAGVYAQDADVVVRNSTLHGNTGAIRVDAGTLLIENSLFTLNVETVHAVADGITVRDTTFQDNVSLDGGALWLGGPTTLERCTFTDNQASDDGGAVYGGPITDVDSTYEGNVAAGWGGGVMTFTAYDGTNLVFRNNSAAQAGAILLGGDGPTSVIRDSLLELNTAIGRGGAIVQKEGGVSTPSQLSLEYTLIQDNVAATGGGMTLELDSSVTCLGDPTGTWGFLRNEATGVDEGGGIYMLDWSVGQLGPYITLDQCDMGTAGYDNIPDDIKNTSGHSWSGYGDDTVLYCEDTTCN